MRDPLRRLRPLSSVLSFGALACVTACASPPDSPEPVQSTSAKLSDVVDPQAMPGFSPDLNESFSFVLHGNPDGSSSKYVVRADGRVQSFGTLQREAAVARRARYGALQPTFASYISTLAPDAVVEAAVWYARPPLTADEHANIASDDDATRMAAVDQLLAENRAASQSLRAALSTVGASVREAGIMPALIVQATSAEIQVIARREDITGIGSNRAIGAQAVNYSAPNSMTNSKISTVINTGLGLFGDGFNLGMVDDPQSGIWDAHVAFSNTSVGGVSPAVTFDNPPHTCATVGAACTGFPYTTTCQTFADASARCADPHASQSASAAVATKNGSKWGAMSISFSS
jgi:hypothetical protein